MTHECTMNGLCGERSINENGQMNTNMMRKIEIDK